MAPRILLLLILASPAMTLLQAEDRTLPSRDARVVVPLLLQGAAHANLRGVERILGAPDEAFVSGFTIYVFHLDDFTSVYVSTHDKQRVFSIRRSALGQNAATLYESLGDDLSRPSPTSAPF